MFLKHAIAVAAFLSAAAISARAIAQPPPRQLGIFGKDPVAFGQWLGRPVDYVLVFGGQDNGWHDFEGSIWYQTDVWKNAPIRKLLWSAPLIPKQWNASNPRIADLKTAGTGAYDDHYRNVANMVAGQDPNATIRIGWEFNGDWYPWAVGAPPNDPPSYAAAFRDYVRVLRSVSPNFKIMWCVSAGQSSAVAEASYPGDDMVDLIGADVYENRQYTTGAFDLRWSTTLAQESGLNWLGAFAAAHHKRISLPEWATNYDYVAGRPSFIQSMYDWMVANSDVVSQSYWDSNSAFDGGFDTHPTNGVIFKSLFSHW
jgi:hypothetical protein